jgi:hypothetical protein
VRLKVALAFITVSVGGFMLIDGVRNLLTGTYFGSSLGPWSKLVSAAGFDPQHFGLVFSLLGLVWFAALAGLFMRARWGVPVAVCVGIATLWYAPVGTLFALVYLALVIWQRKELS